MLFMLGESNEGPVKEGRVMTCGRCGRKLKTAKSIEAGFGPVCKKKHEEAEAEFLKRQITIDEEIEYQTAVKS